MQSNITKTWLNQRGITDEVIALFNIKDDYREDIGGECIKIPINETHAKYRRNPLDDRKPKYISDFGLKATLYGADKADFTKPILITEGELDTLVAWSKNIQAVSSTAGALSFKEEWLPFFQNKVYLCFDNDDTGADGMIKILKTLPDAYIVLIPEQPNIKDISDYVAHGGDLHELLSTAKQYPDIETVKEDMLHRRATWQSVRFHKRYLEKNQQDLHKTSYDVSKYYGDDVLLKAKSYPMDKLIRFDRKKAICPWHKEKTPSLHFYPKSNSAYCFGGCGRAYDSIDAYRLLHDCSFKKAVNDLSKKA